MNEESSMNLEDRISKETLLYGYIAISASTNRLSHNFNKTFKAKEINGMMIPMNIREDDFYFTLSNMKKSHVNGAMLGIEYQQDILELLDNSSEMVQKCGACDFVKRVGQTLHGEFIAGEVLKKFIDSKQGVKKIAIIGDTPLAYSLAIVLKEYELFFFESEIEKLLKMSEALHVNIDINYLAPNGVDFSGFDLLIDTKNDNIGFDNLLDFYTTHLIEDLNK